METKTRSRSTLATRIAPMAIAIWASVHGTPALAGPAELIRVDFNAPIDHPFVSMRPQALQAEGLLHSKALGGWRRGGLRVGSLPMPKGALVIEYDFRPAIFGAQGQSFVSEEPSTHWYMFYANPQGWMQLHTRLKDQWQSRGSSPEKLVLGDWYHMTVTLMRTSIRLVVTQRDSERQVWDTGAAAMDDIGQTTTFMLTDESNKESDGATQWRNLVVTTEDAAFAAQFLRTVAEEAERQRRRKEEAAEAKETGHRLRSRGIALIPTPRRVRFGEGSFDLATAAIAFPAGLEDEARAVRQILGEQANLRPALQAGGNGGITLARVSSGPWPPGKTRPSEGYRLMIRPGGVAIEAQAKAGFLAAAQTLAQLAREGPQVPALEITDWPAIENRLVMIAVSQGGFHVIDPDYWRRMIRELAAVKINMVMPYFETGTFYYEKYPFLNLKGRDGFTAEKARLVSEYARQRGIELLPQQQSLGHAGYLGHKELAHLAESDGVVCPSKPEVYAFLGDLYNELAAAFPDAQAIHVGGDEFGPGFAKCPQCKARAEKIGKSGLYAEHIMRLRQMLAQRNRKMMIWWHEEGFTEAAADRLAKDIAVFDWHYDNQASYPSLARLQKAGFQNLWATPAVTRYYYRPNDFDLTFGNIRGFLTAAAEAGLPGECTCTWCHGIWGGRNLFELNYYALLYSAQCAWKPANSEEDDFRWRFARHWFGLKGEGLADEMMAAWHAPFGPSDQQRFWQNSPDAEPWLAAAPGETIAEIARQPSLPKDAKRLLEFCAGADEVLGRWKATATRNRSTVDFLAHDVHIYQTLARRIIALDELTRRWAEARPAPGRRAAILQPVIADLEKLVGDYRQMERMFDRSIKEAGGARCGQGSFYGGEIVFRSQQGRAGIEKLVQRLKSLVASSEAPERAW